MRTTLIAAAVLGALSATAFADGSVQLYGQVNVVGVYSDNGLNDGKASTKKLSIDQGNTPSRIGFKGEEDLGNGLKAWFQIETRVNTDDAANSNFASREGWVGLQGDFGKVGLGRGKTPYTNVADTFDGLVDGARNLAIYSPDSVISNRFDNAIRFDSASFSGLTFAAMYGTGETKDDAAKLDNNDKVSLAVRYTAGPLFLAAAYNNETNGVNPDTKVNPDKKAENGRDSTGYLLAGTYTIDAIKLGLGYQRAEKEAAAVKFKRDSFVTTVSYAMGPTTLKGGAIFGSKAKIAGVSQDNSQFVRYTIGAKHALSKRTAALVEFSGDETKGNNADPKALSVGLLHSF